MNQPLRPTWRLLLLVGTLTISQLLVPASASAGAVGNRESSQPLYQWRPQGWGLVVRYAPSVMERVRDLRARRGELHINWSVSGWAAVPDCKRIGHLVYLWKAGRRYAFQIVDCSQTRDWRAHTLRGTRAWAEIDHQAARWFLGDRGHGSALITFP